MAFIAKDICRAFWSYGAKFDDDWVTTFVVMFNAVTIATGKSVLSYPTDATSNITAL